MTSSTDTAPVTMSESQSADPSGSDWDSELGGGPVQSVAPRAVARLLSDDQRVIPRQRRTQRRELTREERKWNRCTDRALCAITERQRGASEVWICRRRTNRESAAYRKKVTKKEKEELRVEIRGLVESTTGMMQKLAAARERVAALMRDVRQMQEVYDDTLGVIDLCYFLL